MAFRQHGNAWQDRLPDVVVPVATAIHFGARGVRAVVLARGA